MRATPDVRHVGKWRACRTNGISGRSRRIGDCAVNHSVRRSQYGGLAMRSGVAHVHRRVEPDSVLGRLVELATDLARHPGDQRSRRDLRALGDERVGRDQAALADHRAVEHSGSHPDEHVVADRAAVQDRVVAHRHPAADGQGEAGIGVQHAAVLDVGARPDGDLLQVAAQDRAVPDAHLRGQAHPADHRGVRRQPGALVDFRRETADLNPHGSNVTPSGSRGTPGSVITPRHDRTGAGRASDGPGTRAGAGRRWGMRIGVPREVKEQEFRVALTPAGAGELARHGHEVLVERGAGVGSGFPDTAYAAAGARIAADAASVWREAELVLKVKEPVRAEFGLLRSGQVLFTFLHLAASRECTEAILASGTTAIAYETVRAAGGSLPLLAPRGEAAGKLAAQVGAYHLMAPLGGAGVLFGGVPGVRPAHVAVLGGGVAGGNAAAVAAGMGARVSVLDTDLARLRRLDTAFHGRIATLASNAAEIERTVLDADLVIGSVLVPGARAPKLVTTEMVARMRPGAVLVDIAIDQGGCFEGSHPTTHAAPTFPV